MAITAAQVKELRERTGAGMMECKKALVAVDGDIEKAIDAMRKAGQATAVKKASRVAAEGVIIINPAADNKSVIMLELNSETDFVARDENFMGFANKIAELALSAKTENVEQLLALAYDDSDTIEQGRQHLVAKLGENINIRRVVYMQTDGVVGTYLHGGRIGVVVSMQTGSESLAKDIAMHIAASSPLVIAAEDVSEELINQEREVFTAQAEKSGKPAEIIEKMIAGRINKYLAEVSLLGQPYVKDPSMTVEKLLKADNAEVVAFTRFVVGEGIEKKADNFAEEVMAQVQGD